MCFTTTITPQPDFDYDYEYLISPETHGIMTVYDLPYFEDYVTVNIVGWNCGLTTYELDATEISTLLSTHGITVNLLMSDYSLEIYADSHSLHGSHHTIHLTVKMIDYEA